ncbi:unnamed protein product, partial [Meganyctiphanes norvegica]
AIRCNKYKKQKPEIIIPTEDATAFYFNEKYSTRSWTELRLFLLKFNVKLPKRNDIDIEKKNLHPTIISQEIKSFVHYPDLIDDTVQGILKVTAHNVKTGDILELDAKTGIDGSGSHRARHQKVDSAKSLEENPHLNPEIHKNYLLTCFCPLSLYSVKGGLKTEIWKT